MIIQLSPRMKRRVEMWQNLGHEVDWELLAQCAYYPKGGCQDCSLKQPKPKCKRSHILRLEPSTTSQPRAEGKRKEEKEVKVFGKKLEDVLKMLTPEDQQKVRELINLVRK